MPFRNRLLIGMNGYEPDVHLIRYASMVVRLKSAQRLDGPRPDQASWSGAPNSVATDPTAAEGDDPEIRFVYLLPKRKAAKLVPEPQRGELRAQVRTYLTGVSERVVVGCDLLKGHALRRLSHFAADFDSDLLL